MKTFKSLQFHLHKCTSLFIVFMLLSGFSTAGDIKIEAKYMSRLIHQYRNQPITADVENIESYPVNGANLKITIRHKLSLDIAYQWQTELGTVDPKSKQTIEAPNPWIPQMTGKFKLFFELNSLNDINSLNDTASYNLEVLPMPYFNFDFYQFNFINPFQQENSSTGRIDFTVPPGDTTQYINCMLALPNSIMTPQWLVQNVPLPAFPDTQKVSYWIDLEKLGVLDGQGVPYLMYDLRFGNSPVLEPFPSDNMFLSKVGKDNYDVGGENNLEEEFPFPQSTFSPVIDWGDGEWKLKTWNYRGCKVPNIDLDSSTYNPRDMDGEVGDWNACGPAAAVNSLQWLEDSMKNIPKTNTTLREKISIYNKLSNRSNESGMKAGELIEGKLAFIDSFKLPIRVKWQGYPYFDSVPSPDTTYKHLARHKNDSMWAKAKWDWLVEEMEHGEDVEILFGWHDSTNHRHGGHWVEVSGVSDVNIAKGIYVKDDGNQRGPGGTRQTYVNWVTNDKGRSRLVGFKAKNNYCWVESVVSESYDSTVTFGIGNPKVKKVKVDEGPANWNSLKGLFEFSFMPSDVVRFLNVFANKPGSTGSPVWIIKNLALPPFDVDQDLSAWFDFSWLGFQPGDIISEIDLGYSIGSDIVDFNSTLFNGTLSVFSVIEDHMNISLNFNNRPDIDVIIPPNELTPYEMEPYKTWEYRGCKVPNIDLDSSTYNHTTVEGYAGDKNACGPAGAANSMQWLEDKYKQIDTETTHRKKLEELSGFMSRGNDSTVSDENFVKGKLAFIDKYKLPIRVKMQGIFFGSDSITSPNATYGHFAENKNDTTDAYPEWDWLVNEMKEDEDVEIGIAWYDSTGRSLGGHWVTASGVSEVGSYRGLYVKDDGNQKTAGGIRQQFTNVDYTDGGKPYLIQLSSENSICMLEAVVSESYDEGIKFIPIFSEQLLLHNDLNLSVFENPSSRLNPISISFDLSEPGKVELRIYDITGKLVYLKEDKFGSRGNKIINWNGKENDGDYLRSGTYFVQLKTQNKESTVKIIRK